MILEYRAILISMLNDSIPNIRTLAMKVAGSKLTLMDKIVESQILKMKQDTDLEVRQAAKLIKL